MGTHITSTFLGHFQLLEVGATSTGIECTFGATFCMDDLERAFEIQAKNEAMEKEANRDSK